jgi:mannose-6-phosphate isomerase-like protein (cupin superfamily)
MHTNIKDVKTHSPSEGVIEKILLKRSETESGDLEVKHYTLTKGKIAFNEDSVEYQHYIISGSTLFKGRILHGETGIFIPGNVKFEKIVPHTFYHVGEGELRILSAIYHIPRPNFRWAKTRIKNMYQVPEKMSGISARQLFTEEEHALMGALRMHSLDLQTHAPGIILNTHRNPEEFGYILRGFGEVTAGNTTYKVSPGSLVYTPEGVPHSIKNTSQNLPLQYIAFEFTKQDESWSEMYKKKQTS